MIKRRFYKQEHGDKDAASGSSSSSDSELDAEASVDTEDEEEQDYDNNVVVESKKKDQPCSSSSGYESEDSSGNEVNLDASGLPTNDDGSDSEDENYKQDVINTRVSADNHSDKKVITKDVSDCVLKSKSVFKCKLCPRIVCLTEETLKAHLKSKRHARSEKLLKEGRLKMMLNSDGELEEEEDGETHQERHAKTLALLQPKNASELKKNKGRQRQRKRLRKKTSDDSAVKKPKKTSDNSAAKKPKKTSDDSAAKKPKKTSDDSSAKKPKKTADDSAAKKLKKSAKKKPKSDI